MELEQKRYAWRARACGLHRGGHSALCAEVRALRFLKDSRLRFFVFSSRVILLLSC